MRKCESVGDSMNRTTKLLALIISIFSPLLAAQTFTWRVSNYGTTPSIAGLHPQSIAFDTSGAVFTAEQIADSNGPGVRIKHISASTGTLLWFSDLPSWYYSVGDSEINPTASIVSVADDVALATTEDDTQLFAGITRLSGQDGHQLWRATEHSVDGLGYQSIAVDSNQDLITAGAQVVTAGGFDDGTIGHVAKFRGNDGTLLWSFSDVSGQCGGLHQYTQFNAVAADPNNDVVVVGQKIGGSGTSFCVIKFDGASGQIRWVGLYEVSNGSWVSSANMKLDADGNALVLASISGDNGSSLLAKFSTSSGSLTWAVNASLSNYPSDPRLFQICRSGDVIVSEFTTQAFSGIDGHTLWMQPAAAHGAVAMGTDGNAVIAQNDALDPEVAAGRRIDFFGLNALDGSTVWTSTLPLNTVAYWDPANELATDHNGHFVALQAQDEICCTEYQSVLALGDTQTGAIEWHIADKDIGPAFARQDFDEYNPLSVIGGDGGVVSIGLASSGIDRSSPILLASRLLIVKRSSLDGHLIWQSTLDTSYEACDAKSIAIDSANDVIAAGGCDGVPILIKYRGSDGAQLWQIAPPASCINAQMQSVIVDADRNVYATGYCESTTAAQQVTTKYAAATGAALWSATAPFGPSFFDTSFIARDSANGIFIGYAGATPLVQKLRADNGDVIWSQNLASSAYPTALAITPNGDVMIGASYSSLTSLAGSTGSQRWGISYENSALNRIAVTATGDVVVAGDGIARYSGASGSTQWNVQSDAEFFDLVLSADGQLLATGTKQPTLQSSGYLYVVSLNSSKGSEHWSLLDDVSPAQPDAGLGITKAPDGGIVVSADNAVSGRSPWSLVRITGPFADDIFENGLER